MKFKTLGTCLSPREIQVIQLACQGNTDRTIARRLAISIHTVRDYWRYSIRPALGAADRTQAVSLAVKKGLADPDRRDYA
ncbi:response regulator transcription factor [Streptomyces sp. NPDC054838]